MTRALIIALLVAPPAHASVFETYGFGARATAMTGAHAAFATDYTGAFYNPGALTQRKRTQIGLGVNMLAPSLAVRAQGRPAADAPAPALPGANVGVHLGALFPLGGRIGNRLAVGLGAYIPTLRVTRVEALDPEVPQAYRYGSAADKLGLALAAAFELHPRVSLGAGVQLLGGIDGAADVQLDVLTQRFTRKDLRVDVRGAASPTAGVLVRATDTLRFGASFRGAVQLDYELLTRIDLLDVGLIEIDIDGVALYTPQHYTLAAAWTCADLTLTGDLVWARWSQAPEPAAGLQVTLDGAPLGLGDLGAESAPVPLGAVDTVEPRLGVAWTPGAWALRGGYSYRPSPLPAQTSYSNYADSAAHIVGLGAGVRFADPLALHRAPISLDVAAQLTWVTDREMRKRDPSDRVGDYVFGGPVWQGSFTLRHDFD